MKFTTIQLTDNRKKRVEITCINNIFLIIYKEAGYIIC